MHRIPFRALLAVTATLTLTAVGPRRAAASFPITIDATALSIPEVTLSATGPFDSSVVQNVVLPAGIYSLHYAAATVVSVPFEVTAAGTIDFDPALAGILDGAGTSTMTVNGVTIDIDASALTVPEITFAVQGGFPPLAPQLFSVTVLPGLHNINYAASVPSPFVNFTVTGAGLVDYDPALQGVLDGSGTSVLIINGATIDIDASALTVPEITFAIQGGLAPFPPQLFTMTLLPGTHNINYIASVPMPFIDFTVTNAGLVDYAPGLQGVLDGAGTTLLLVNGATIDIDASPLTVPVINFPIQGGIAPFAPQLFTMTLLPGVHNINYFASVPTPSVDFLVTTAGLVDYAPDLQGVLDGAGTTTVLVNGATIDIDPSPLSAPLISFPLQEGLTPFVPDPFTMNLLPGVHQVNYISCLPQPKVDFEVTRTGLIDYPPVLEGILTGAGTTAVVLNGAAIEIDGSRFTNATFDVSGLGTFESGCPLGLALLPGSHALITPTFNFDTLLTELGLFDFDPILDPQLSGRGTSTLTALPNEPVQHLCNEPPVAICGGNVTVEAMSPSGSLVQLDGTASFDPDGDPLTYHWDVSNLNVMLDDPAIAVPSGIFPIGVTMATLTVADGNGGVDTCDVLVTVRDTTPPEVMCTSDYAMLWSPNHRMRSITLFVMGTDAVADPEDIVLIEVTVRSDEPDDANGNGDGNTTGDVHGFDGFTTPVDITSAFVFDPSVGDDGAWVAEITLRAECAGGEDGRCYTIDVESVDTSGNVAVTSCCIVVPHDRGGGS